MLVTLSIVMLFLAVSVGAEVPSEFEIECTRIEYIRASVDEYQKYDFDTDRRFHPFMRESINSILGCYGIDFSLERAEGYNDTTVSYYIEQLELKGVKLYRLDKLQGRVMRVLINRGYPLLLLGGLLNGKRHVYRVIGDVLYLYRIPDFSQSSKKLDGTEKYTFKTALGKRYQVKELYSPAFGGFKNAPVDGVYILVTDEISLKKIKKDINTGLNDVGFEYHLPEFKRVKRSAFDWYSSKGKK